MKNLFRILAVVVGMLATSSVSAACGPEGCSPRGNFESRGGDFEPRREMADSARCAERPAGECWCKFSRQVPEYYCCPRCVEETIPCSKTCCRYVKKYHEVQRCRMVPEYYTETCCTEVPEYYQVPDCKTRKVWVNDQKCKYRTECYWKKVCQPECGNNGCAQ